MFLKSRKFNSAVLALIILLLLPSLSQAAYIDNRSALVFLTDFGLKVGDVSSMKAVAFGVDSDLKMFDITHEIPNYNIWEGAYRFKQTASYWPKGTVFVGVVDPGVGTDRESIVLETKNGYYFVGPDNGLFSLVAEDMGIREIRRIDESKQRLKGSEKSHTFHGRDIFAYVGGKLASHKLQFEEIGPKLSPELKTISYQKAMKDGSKLKGNIPILDAQYGNIWTNISDELFESLGVEYGQSFNVEIFKGDKSLYKKRLPFGKSFGDVSEGEELLYLNDMLNLSLAINMDNFSTTYGIFSGPEWTIEISK